MKAVAVSAFAVAITMSLAMSASHAQQSVTTSVDRAEVIDVQPYRDASVADGPQYRLRQECWNERTRVYEGGYYRDNQGRLYRGDSDSRSNTSGMLIGAVIGGALGNQVGKGDGRTAATVAGAVVGGAIGAHVGNDEHEFRGNDGVVRRCRTVVTQVGFRPSDRDFMVTYRYAGRIYTARTEHNPGRWLPVNVNVRPQDTAINSR
jgi:uncharacterized protein YcfJ